MNRIWRSMATGCPKIVAVILVSVGISGIIHDSADAQTPPAPPAVTAPASQPSSTVLPPASDVPGASPTGAPSAPQSTGGDPAAEPVVPVGREGYVYLPEGRRDPFLTILRGVEAAGADKKIDELNLPPLQRITVSELTVIGIVWGGFGYVAMVQTPDGKGYAIQRGVRVGNNNGVVSAITEKAVIVEERFTDIYGKKQVREYAKPLHAKESLP